ncbi:MAG: hypothetical protein K6G80_09745 [Treponema sp.]|nr:hypothetical protein [Treponema sp.]
MEKFTLSSRSKDRWIFFFGMLAAFIGLMIPYVRIEDEGVFNVFTGGIFFNEPGIAYISTFIWIVFLALLGSIIAFFLSKNIVLDYVCWLIAASFGIAELITISVDFELIPFAWMFIGSYVTCIGMIAALVGLIRQLLHLKK